MGALADRLRRVEDRLRAAERRAGRRDGSVTLCAVSKTFPPEAVVEAVVAGVADVGENRVQEAQGKRPAVEALGARARWHLIGHLQSNKARRAVELFEVLQSVDSLDLARRLETIAGQLGRRPEVLVQVDLGLEPTKSGALEAEVAEIVEFLRDAEHLRLTGLMTVPPFFDEPERTRPYFRRLRELTEGYGLAELSMGMSHDFEVAVEEGATLVRVGTAIFGTR
jgi:pyridoxal phosphate enzyme (YggS family)